MFRTIRPSFSRLFFWIFNNDKLFNIPAANSMQYGQNNLLPYAQQQTDHNNMFGNDHKDNILKAKMERERDEGMPHHQMSAPYNLAPH